MSSRSNNSNRNKAINKSSKKKSSGNLLTIIGVLLLGGILVYLMYYFFVENSNLKVNMSTDKKIEYITVESKEELISTQKYVSDLNYSMRYDINSFKVFKYKEQDIYKCVDNENILVVVQKSSLPNKCSSVDTENGYNNCYVRSDSFTDEYYISANGRTYKIMIKVPSPDEQKVNVLIGYMLNSFNMIF